MRTWRRTALCPSRPETCPSLIGRIFLLSYGIPSPAPINYETAVPQGVGNLVKQEDGSLVLANEHEQGFMVNQAIIDFWKSCNGKRKVTELVDLFAQQTGLQRTQVEKEVMQLLKQLHEGGLLVIPNQNDVPNVEFKGRN